MRNRFKKTQKDKKSVASFMVVFLNFLNALKTLDLFKIIQVIDNFGTRKFHKPLAKVIVKYLRVSKHCALWNKHILGFVIRVVLHLLTFRKLFLIKVIEIDFK